MKVVEVVVGAEGNDLHRYPAPVVAAVAIESIQRPVGDPDQHADYMHIREKQHRLQSDGDGQGI